MGRYLDADPIELNGGANPFGYAYADPLHYLDLTGEFAWLLPVIGWGAIGAAVD
ncbi:RHS repeat-associated core domain-containing protein [Hirschia baltica]|uniref:hypothetical protein n=1 Tax=Hirschia baltica TaxID=2724 RepID=UPI00031B9C61|nr:hypothetical protein [Hirschia baltica]